MRGKVENNQSPTVTGPELVAKNFTKVPNWFFDELLKAREPGLVCVAAYLMRQFVGWKNRAEFDSTSKELKKVTGLHTKTVSRWLNALDALGWIKYTPAKNGGGESNVRFLRLPEHAVELRMLVAALRLTDYLEKKWARENTYMARSEHNSYIEWLKRPRMLNDAFSGTLMNCFEHIKGCAGCDNCCVVPEVVVLQQSIKRPPPK
jgi:hypothetical protein